MIRFSFLIPFWNLDFSVMQRMLHSIPERSDVEILLLDNASDQSSLCFDDTLLCDVHFHIITLKERVTAGRCRNILIEKAQGEWIVIADADDRYFTEQLQFVLDSPAIEDYDIVYWGSQTLFTEGKILNELHHTFGSHVPAETISE